MTGRLILNTDALTTHPWPDDVFIQGGARGVVFDSAGDTYLTAFVEGGPPDTFIRGEGKTIAEAETAMWEKYQRRADCPQHEYEARGYQNGAGFCKHCNHFGVKVFTGEQLGQHCRVCGVGTTYSWHRVEGSDPPEYVYECEAHLTPAKDRPRPTGLLAGVIHDVMIEREEES